ncbi:MAG: hypothetical protein KGZ88_10515 [Methylomicrobium sp.]|nr:hypothetical protein [Methylomicrobium sp.]
MDKEKMALYTDHLTCNQSLATAPNRSAMLDGEVSPDSITRYLSARLYTSKTCELMSNPPFVRSNGMTTA